VFLVIPSIVFEYGKCRKRISGEPGTGEFYNKLFEEPAELCKLFRHENVKAIHIIDWDSFQSNRINNFEKIATLPKATSLPFQVFANFSTYSDCENLLNNGIHRIILPASISQYKELTRELIKKFTSSRVVFDFPVNEENEVDIGSGNGKFSISEYVAVLKQLNIHRIVYHSSRDLTEILGNRKNLDLLAANFQRWTLEYDVKDYKELYQVNELKKYGLDSLILGESFYSTNFPCQKIWRIAESRLDANDDEFKCDF